MTPRTLTLMAVHAHPDDEASSTGGTLARYSDEGIRTVLVTCTNGELGDGPNGVKPDDPNHDETVVVATRRRELERSCEILGVSALETLGFHDSGMMGWPQNDAPNAFWNIPVDVASQRLIPIIDRYQPHVIVTYDANGFYGHPDHIQAHRITIAAAHASSSSAKIYFPGAPKSGIGALGEEFRQAGVDLPFDPEQSDFGTPDDLISAIIDCTAVADRKYDALAAHASQSENTFFLQLDRRAFARVFGKEAFVRHPEASAASKEDDLFAGLR